jgi:chemotaxis protein MotB
MRRKRDTENTDRWVISYADFITLLFAFFATMYALSAIDAEKLEKFAVSMKKAFKSNTIIDKERVIPELSSDNPMGHIETEIRSVLKNMNGNIIIRRDERGIIISLGAGFLFDPGDATLKEDAIKGISELALVFKNISNRILIEGHTDSLPPSNAVYKSNWELSALRAIAVLRVFVERFHLPPERFIVAGYAQYRPLRENATPEGRAMNRRVDIVILKNGELVKGNP